MNARILCAIFLLFTCPSFGQQVIKGYSKPATFHIVPSKDTASSSLAITTNFEFYKNERKTALIIGNGNYKNGPLKNAVNEALDMAATLGGKGFKVILRENASRIDMRSAIREFGTEINQGGVGLFYYSGHGIQIDVMRSDPVVRVCVISYSTSSAPSGFFHPQYIDRELQKRVVEISTTRSVRLH